MKKLPFTIIILTNRNDQIFIDSLQSAQIAQEVIVVDNNSQNRWSQLKKTLNFTIIAHPECITDFSAVRNAASKRASHSWVFFLDSDEVLSASNYPELQKLLTQTNTVGFYVKRNDIFLSRKLSFGEPASLWFLRLYQTDKGTFTRPIHESLLIKGKTQRSHIILEHHSHLSLSDFLRTVSQYASVEATTRKQLPLTTILQAIVYPPIKFVYNYFFRLGFLDGFRGLIYAVMMSLHSFFVRATIYEKSL